MCVWVALLLKPPTTFNVISSIVTMLCFLLYLGPLALVVMRVNLSFVSGIIFRE